MRPSGIILGLILAIRITAHPTDGDGSSWDKPFYYRRAAQIFERDRPVVQQRQESPSQLAPFPTGPSPTPTPPPPTQSCTAINHGLFSSYSVLIRVAYRGAKFCDYTYSILESWVPVSNWQCVENDGYIQLWFNAAIGVEIARQINGALEYCYPEVAGGFNCPAY